MKQSTSLTRRAFLEKAATVTAIGFAAPHIAAAAESAPAQPSPGPNSRIHLGTVRTFNVMNQGTQGIGFCPGRPAAQAKPWLSAHAGAGHRVIGAGHHRDW